MTTDERAWAEEAISVCVKAKEKGLLILVARMQDGNDEQDLILTNAATPELVQALAAVLTAETREIRREE